MRKKPNTPGMVVAVAAYLPEQYPMFLATAEDADQIDPTWEEWRESLQDAKKNFALQGIDLIEVTVELEAFERYCQEHGRKNNSSTRAEYAAKLLSERTRQIQQHRSRPQHRQRMRKKKGK